MSDYARVRRIPIPVDLDTSPEIDALPEGSVIFDSDSDVIIKAREGWRFWGDDSEFTEEATICLPAIVIHEPSGDSNART